MTRKPAEDTRQKPALAPAGHWHLPVPDLLGRFPGQSAIQRMTIDPTSHVLVLCLCCACALAWNGCAVHYYDEKSGVEHVWGIGHVKMKSAPVTEEVDSVISGTSVAGVSIGAGREDFHLTAGWDYRRRIVLGTNAAIGLDWPDADFFNVRPWGPEPPFLRPGYRYSVATNQ